MSAEYGVSSMQIGRWKKTLSDRAAELFETRSSMDPERYIRICFAVLR